MRCTNCGREIPEGALTCPRCRQPVSIVTDYTSLEHMLADEVNDMLEGKDRSRIGGPSEALDALEDLEYATEEEAAEYKKEAERRAARRRKALQEKKKKQAMAILVSCLCIFIIGAVVFLLLSVGRSTYDSQMKRADKAFSEGDYTRAAQLYIEAGETSPNRYEPKIGLANCYLTADNYPKAQEQIEAALALDRTVPENWLLLAQVYEAQGMTSEISSLFAGCDDKNVLELCAAYISPMPDISPDGGAYNDYIQVSMSASSGTIHYTMDDSHPTADSPVYTEPITLAEDGNFVIRAIAINDKGVAGPEKKSEFSVDIPMLDGPSVSPVSGVYTHYMQISVDVPEGLTVYYTLDGSEPSVNSYLYEGPIDMPYGQTTFSCISVSGNGRVSSVIKRQYNRISIE